MLRDNNRTPLRTEAHSPDEEAMDDILAVSPVNDNGHTSTGAARSSFSFSEAPLPSWSGDDSDEDDTDGSSSDALSQSATTAQTPKESSSISQRRAPSENTEDDCKPSENEYTDFPNQEQDSLHSPRFNANEDAFSSSSDDEFNTKSSVSSQRSDLSFPSAVGSSVASSQGVGRSTQWQTRRTVHHPLQSEFDKALTDVVSSADRQPTRKGFAPSANHLLSLSTPQKQPRFANFALSPEFEMGDNKMESVKHKLAQDPIQEEQNEFLSKAELNVLDEVLSSEQDSSANLSEKKKGKQQKGVSISEKHNPKQKPVTNTVHSDINNKTVQSERKNDTYNDVNVKAVASVHQSQQLQQSNTVLAGNRGAGPSSGGASTSISTNQKSLSRCPSRGRDLQSMSSSSAPTIRPKPEDLSSGMLPDVLMTMRQKIESLTLFDSDMMKLAEGTRDFDENYDDEEERASKESLRRSFQQSISAAVLVSLAHKRYERRRLAAMEIEKVVRSLVHQGELERVRAILLLLSDDYVRSTSEDARKGGVVALAACAIGLKKANPENGDVVECKDLILAAVVHACQDHSQRVRYYATESLFNVIKVIPAMAVQHFFILFEILRSLYADVDLDVRSGAQLLDKKLKEVIVAAINNGSFTADACVPLFARYVHVRNKPTKRLTLTWLQEFSEKLVGSPMLEFLHLFLGGIFSMLADPNASIRQLALAFLETVLPQLLVNNEDFEEGGTSMSVDFDKILQSLVTTMEHPDPFVRKVAMYWMSRIVAAHMSDPTEERKGKVGSHDSEKGRRSSLSGATISVRNCLPHVLPGILLSIGDTFHSRPTHKDTFLPDLTTHTLAEQTNTCLQNAVRRDGKAYLSHLDGFIVALREELDSPGGVGAKNTPAVERKPYRMDVKSDGSGIESTGWFRSSDRVDERDDAMMMSRLCALQWVTVLYESVVPDSLKAEYAREFISPIIHQLVENPPEIIIFKSFEVLAKITVPDEGEKLASQQAADTDSVSHPTAVRRKLTNDADAVFALDILDESRRQFKSRDREVFAALIHLHAHNHRLLTDLSRVIEFMCTLQPPEFVFVSFALELHKFVVGSYKTNYAHISSDGEIDSDRDSFARDLDFVSCFVQQMCSVLLTATETADLRSCLQDCIGGKGKGVRDEQRARLFHILLHAFAHNLVAALSLCLWGGAFLTAAVFLHQIDPLDINLMFYLELDQLIELLERPLFRRLHIRMLQGEDNSSAEGNGAMLFRTLKSLLMLLPQSTSYTVLRNRLSTVAKFRQSTVRNATKINTKLIGTSTEMFVSVLKEIRQMHCDAKWRTIRAESLEPVTFERGECVDENQGRRDWLGFADEEEEKGFREKIRRDKKRSAQHRTGVTTVGYNEFHQMNSFSAAQYQNGETVDRDNPASRGFRHPDEVLPKDQINNFHALTKHGLIHQVTSKNIPADLKPAGVMARNASVGSSGDGGQQADGEKSKWKEYWLQTEEDE